MSSVANPDKLRHLGPVSDLGALLRERSELPGLSWFAATTDGMSQSRAS